MAQTLTVRSHRLLNEGLFGLLDKEFGELELLEAEDNALGRMLFS
jgi:hypothetical protein